jgi:hypothetical protein
LHSWTRRYRRLQDAWLALSRARRRRPVPLGLEALEVRELLNASFEGLSAAPLSADLGSLRDDLTTSALVNAAQSSQAKTTSFASLQSQWNKTWNVLLTDWNQTWHDFVQLEYAAVGAHSLRLDTILYGLATPLPSLAPSTSPAATSGEVTASSASISPAAFSPPAALPASAMTLRTALSPSPPRLVTKAPDVPGYMQTAACNCGCSGESGSLVQPANQHSAPVPPESTKNPVRYADGRAPRRRRGRLQERSRCHAT